MPPAASIRRAELSEAAKIAGLIAKAFAPLPAVAWLVPDPTTRPAIFTASFRIPVIHALEHGFVDLIADRGTVHAAAVWFPRNGPLPEPDDYDRRMTAACGIWTDRFIVLDALFDAHHPTAPHHHLAFLAVDPQLQNTGLGSALLRHHHAVLDATTTPAYLEASSRRSRALYLRHGYTTCRAFTLPNGTPFWPMWRNPQHASADLFPSERRIRSEWNGA